jgi:DNA-3-methyladenine glycosylase II
VTSADSYAKKAAQAITAINPRFEPVIQISGLCTIGVTRGKSRARESNFSSLASSILSQQLSTKAAATIIGRVAELSGGTLRAEKLTDIRVSQLRSAGCSEAKARAIKELARSAVDKKIPITSLQRLSDEEIMEHLLPLFGIGRWTVEMFLMFQLGRHDIWPVGDLGVRRGWEKIHRMRTDIEPQALMKLGEKYSPYRSHLAWYCWRAVEVL